MYSVLVFGDVRHHELHSEPEDDGAPQLEESPAIYGGAFMMTRAISDAIDAIVPPPGGVCPRLYGLEADHSEIRGFQIKKWRLEETKLEQANESLLTWLYEDFSEETLEPTPEKQLRLKSVDSRTPKKRERFYPRISVALQNALSRFDQNLRRRRDPPGWFHKNGPEWARSFPDIIVFDDLGGELNQVDLRPWLLETSATAAGVPAATWTSTFKRQYEAALGAVARRLSDAAAQLGTQDPFSLRPVILCSIMDWLPDIKRMRLKGITNLWTCLYDNRELRDRTVVIIDANDLRTHGQLAISTGLSWERTAQETIAELCRSPRCQPLLEFSQLIVRYGATGALHISHPFERHWDYQLYYDPERNDHNWSDEKSEGVVLGQSSVFTATLVQELTRDCNEHGQKPVIQDLGTCLTAAIPIAIARAQCLVHFGYGTRAHPTYPTLEGEDATGSTDDQPADPGAGAGAESGGWEEGVHAAFPFPKDLFGRLSPHHLIARVAVPQLKSRSWSILSQVAQGRVGGVARNIVKYGVEMALRQKTPLQREFCEAFALSLADDAHDLALAGLVPNGAKDELTKQIFLSVDSALDVTIRLPKFQNDALREWIRDSIPIAPILDEMVPVIEKLIQLNKDYTIAALARYGELVESELTHFRIRTSDILSRGMRFPSALDPQFQPVTAPIFQLRPSDGTSMHGFGLDFNVVDRREIEGIRTLQKLIKGHLDKIADDRDPTHHKPLSLAVFGPPGSGKSTAVSRILAALKNHKVKTKEVGTFNLAQFTREDLHTAFRKIVEASALNMVPVAFFDEFDSRFGDEQWGWLKFFLSPMEDGNFLGEPVHTAIFVFAGGTSPTYADFSLENRASTDPQMQEFGKAKGPDFVSRLGGHMNVVGVNPADADDELYLLRRAIIIRNTLERYHKKQQNLPIMIDDDMLRAILFVPKYLNGARSIRKLLEMCSRSSKPLSNSTLPLLNQLNMVTDGKAFLDLLANVSAET